MYVYMMMRYQKAESKYLSRPVQSICSDKVLKMNYDENLKYFCL